MYEVTVTAKFRTRASRGRGARQGHSKPTYQHIITLFVPVLLMLKRGRDHRDLRDLWIGTLKGATKRFKAIRSVIAPVDL